MIVVLVLLSRICRKPLILEYFCDIDISSLMLAFYMPVLSPRTCEYLVLIVFLPREVSRHCAKYQPGEILRRRTIIGYTLGCRIYRHSTSIRGLFHPISLSSP